MKRVWITRASPGAEETARRVRALEFDTLVAPLLEVRPIRGAQIDLAGVGALAFTSANGVGAFAAISAERRLPVFAVGSATARAAWDQGFATVINADGDVKALARLVHDQPPIAGAILHAGPSEPAGDLVGDLNAIGIEARGLAIYETVPTALDHQTASAISGLAGVLLHSQKAAQILVGILTRHPAPRLRAFCLSTAVARPLLAVPIAGVRAAVEPTEAALLEALADGLANQDASR